ncbi:MAG: metallophosphoesterase family protein [Chthoniobacteraceae bacterium]|nr:metallophosphoesterase family protein [Chthoniobacteraceae bacterium]
MPDSPAMAVFSDVHSNLEALEAVLADMDALQIRRRVCLGDLVGYGPDPAACLEKVRALGCPVLQGNHDAAAACEEDFEEMNSTAIAGIELCRQSLTPEQREWLASLPLTLAEDGCEFVHGSLDAPGEWWYVLSPEDATIHFEAQTQPVCFCGHTHDPMLWQSNGPHQLSIRHGEGRIKLPETGKILINVGSVGQPRDRNPDACYAIFHPEARWVQFRRVPYNLEKTKGKIGRAGLPQYSAERLFEGR